MRQGEVYWLETEASGEQKMLRHPYVIVQNNLFNQSKISTTVACMITSNLRLADFPGNVLLEPGQANLPKKCVVNVTQVYTIHKSEFQEYLGRLSAPVIGEIIAGLGLLFQPRELI